MTPTLTGRELIDVAQMRAIDARAAELGVATRVLMENAGRSVAREIMLRTPPQLVLVLAGPGGNGGDGFVVARVLAEGGWPVRVFLDGEPSRVRGDAAEAMRQCPLAIEPLSADAPVEDHLVIDALYGAGLTRPLDPLCQNLARRALRVVSIDVPSGLDGNGAPPRGPTFRPFLTVTFVRKKIAHVLEPGRSLCGEIVVADIGAPERAVAECGARAWENAPNLWRLPWPGPEAHKHARGRAAIFAAASDVSLTDGAARLCARAAQRAGAGWVSAFVRRERAHLWAHEHAALVVRESEGDAAELSGFHAIVFGPGAGRTPQVAATARTLAKLGLPIVLDADALSASVDAPANLFAALGPHVVLTPHAGEFDRLFPDLASIPDKLSRTRLAAARCGAVVLHKGADTVIAAPDARAIVSTHASPWLASAGTGDVLAGIIAGLMAQGMSPFDAAAAGAWLHGECGLRAGPGLIADDLPAHLPAVLDALAPEGLRRRP